MNASNIMREHCKVRVGRAIRIGSRWRRFCATCWK
jgi:hypothetical protein